MSVDQLPFPGCARNHLRGNFRALLREYSSQQFVADLPSRLFLGPAVQQLRAAVPIFDLSVHITDENGVMRQVEKLGLLAIHRFPNLRLRFILPKFSHLIFERSLGPEEVLNPWQS